MTVTFKTWKLAVVWWMRLLRNPDSAVSSFSWQMPYSMKQKFYQCRRAPVLPFWPEWGWEKKPSKVFPLPWYWFGAELGLFHSCHWRGCAFLAFLYYPSAQCKHSAQGYSRRQNYFLLKTSFVPQLAQAFRLQQHYAHDKEFGQEKRKKMPYKFFV